MNYYLFRICRKQNLPKPVPQKSLMQDLLTVRKGASELI